MTSIDSKDSKDSKDKSDDLSFVRCTVLSYFYTLAKKYNHSIYDVAWDKNPDTFSPWNTVNKCANTDPFKASDGIVIHNATAICFWNGCPYNGMRPKDKNEILIETPGVKGIGFSCRDSNNRGISQNVYVTIKDDKNVSKTMIFKVDFAGTIRLYLSEKDMTKFIKSVKIKIEGENTDVIISDVIVTKSSNFK